MAKFFLNPLFLYTMLKLFLPLNIVFKIIFISYFSNILLYFIHKTKGKPLKRNKEIPLGDLLVEEVNNAKDIFLNVLGMIILFNLLSLLIPILVHGTFDSLLFLSSKVSLLMVTILIVYLYISSYFKIKQTSLKTKKITGE